MQKGKRVAHVIGIVVLVFGGASIFTDMLVGDLPNTVTKMYAIMAVAAWGCIMGAAWLYKEYKELKA